MSWNLWKSSNLSKFLKKLHDLSFVNIFEYNGKFNCSFKLLILFLYSSSCLLQLQTFSINLCYIYLLFHRFCHRVFGQMIVHQPYQNKLHYYQPLAFHCPQFMLQGASIGESVSFSIKPSFRWSKTLFLY